MYWSYKKFLSNTNYKFFPTSKCPPPRLKFNTLSPSISATPPYIPGRILHSPVVMALLIASTSRKWVHLMILLNLGKRKNITRSQVGWVVMLIWQCSSQQETAGCLGAFESCVVLVKQPQIILPQLSPLLMHLTKQTLQDHSRHDGWLSGKNSAWTMPPHIEERN